MLDEVVLRVNLGCKISPGKLVAGCFGEDNVNAIVAVSQTLDKLVVHTSSSSSSSSNQLEFNEDTLKSSSPPTSGSNQYVLIKDVIRSLSVQYFQSSAYTSNQLSNDVYTTGSLLFMKEDSESVSNTIPQELASVNKRGLLLVGCSRSLIVYDVTKQNDILEFSISTPVELIAYNVDDGLDSSITICGGQKRLSVVKVETIKNQTMHKGNSELFCERNINYELTCMIRGQMFNHSLIICGSLDQGIFVHQLDMFNLDIRPSELSIKQISQVNCLCAIYTLVEVPKKLGDKPGESTGELSSLPLLHEVGDSGNSDKSSQQTEHLNYFAYGLENGIIGVYYLFLSRTLAGDRKPSMESSILQTESLWKQKCKQAPVSMQMYDMNGDGFEELIIGYRNGRLDVRSPFTGQLLASTKCFRQSSDRLAGVAVVDYYSNGEPMLLACSTSGHINGYMPRYTKSRVPLRAYNMAEEANQLIYPAIEDLNQMSHSIKSVLLRGEEEVPDDDPNSFISSLHIESGRGDNMRSQRSESRQNSDYLLKINSLLNERMELEKQARQLYRKRFENEFKLSDDKVLAQHRWDFDYITGRLRLTIVLGANKQGVRATFMKLEDERKNFLEKGCLLVDMDTSNEDQMKKSYDSKSQVVVIPLRPKVDGLTTSEIKLSIFFGNLHSSNNDCQMVQVLTKSIEIPQYSMLVFSRRQDSPWVPKLRLNCRLYDGPEPQQILDWFREKLLSFRFGCLTETGHSDDWATSKHSNSVAIDENGGFEINLVDALASESSNMNQEDSIRSSTGGSNYYGQALRIAYRKSTNESDADHQCVGHLSLECESSSSHSSLSLFRWLVIDRLQSTADSSEEPRMELVVEMEPILGEIRKLEEQITQLKETEERLRSELYELSQYTGSLMQQLCISNELNEYTTSKELLNELFMMLNEAQNAARAQTLTCRSRRKLDKKLVELKEELGPFLTG